MTTEKPPIITTAVACNRLGISASTFTLRAAQAGIQPAMQLPGKTGAKLWAQADIDTLAAQS